MIRNLVLATLLCVASLSASAQSVQERVSDLRLETAVRLALVADSETRPADVDVAARSGSVSLSGEIPFASRTRIVSVTRSVPGVASVSGLGASPTDRPVTQPVRIEPAPATGTPRSTPVPRTTSSSSEAAYHTVASGDTLFGLARRYETTVDAILRLNNMENTQINLGQRVRVR